MNLTKLQSSSDNDIWVLDDGARALETRRLPPIGILVTHPQADPAGGSMRCGTVCEDPFR